MSLYGELAVQVSLLYHFECKKPVVLCTNIWMYDTNTRCALAIRTFQAGDIKMHNTALSVRMGSEIDEVNSMILIDLS